MENSELCKALWDAGRDLTAVYVVQIYLYLYATGKKDFREGLSIKFPCLHGIISSFMGIGFCLYWFALHKLASACAALAGANKEIYFGVAHASILFIAVLITFAICIPAFAMHAKWHSPGDSKYSDKV